MNFSEFITCVNRALRTEELNNNSFTFYGDEANMVVKPNEAVFVITKNGQGQRGVFTEVTEDSIIVEGAEIPFTLIVFIGKI